MTAGWAFPWALALAPLVVPYWVLALRAGGAGIAYPRAGAVLAAGGAGRRSRWRARLPELLRGLALLLLVLALAGPRTAGAALEERRPGVPIVIAFDISSSMLAEDFAPDNRLEVARRTTIEFVRARAADPIGLVAFAGEAITQVPITTDARVLVAALNSLRIGLLEDGTAIGMGLATAATRLAPLDAESKVIVLLSDGENNRGEIEPLEAAAAAAAQGIRVFTIGVGTEDAAPVPLPRRADGTVAYAELAAGLDEELLRRIAATTGGEYLRADSPDALSRVFSRLDELVPSPVETVRHTPTTEWYLLLVLLAGLVLATEWLVRGSRWGRVP
jgi:Ca-activated chloride channel homolog